VRPREPLKPGQVRISGPWHPLKRPQRSSHGGGGLLSFLLLVLGLLVVEALDHIPSASRPVSTPTPSESVPAHPQPTAPASESRMIPMSCRSLDPVELAFSASCAVPPPPEYPRKYAAFIPRHPDDKSGKAARAADEPLRPAIVFTNENLDVIQVPSLNSIPAADRKASRIVGADGAKYQSADPNIPFILFGPVDLEVGPLVGSAQLETALLANHGNVRAVEMVFGNPPTRLTKSQTGGSIVDLESADLVSKSREFDSAMVRGPPLPRSKGRKVYVVGEIKQYHGPSLYDQSVLKATVFDLDLGPDGSQLAEYYQRLDHWRDNIASGLGIPREMLNGVDRPEEVKTLRDGLAERNRRRAGTASEKRMELELERRRAEESERPREVAR
jgi:hypothetical protein